jgi:hypothetical protein
MTLQLGQAISDGIGRVLSTTGAVLFAGLLAIQLVTQVGINTTVVGFLPPEAASAAATGSIGLSLPLPPGVGVALTLVGIVMSTVYFVVLARALSRPRRELSTLPSTLYSRRIVRATLATFLAGFVASIAVSIGFVLLVLPGIFLAASFLLFIFPAGVEDRGALGSLRRSWGLARENRLRLSLLVVAVGVVGGLVGTVGALLDGVGLDSLSDVAVTVVNSGFFIVVYGTVAAVYRQLRDEESAAAAGSASGTDETAKL